MISAMGFFGLSGATSSQSTEQVRVRGSISSMQHCFARQISRMSLMTSAMAASKSVAPRSLMAVSSTADAISDETLDILELSATRLISIV